MHVLHVLVVRGRRNRARLEGGEEDDAAEVTISAASRKQGALVEEGGFCYGFMRRWRWDAGKQQRGGRDA